VEEEKKEYPNTPDHVHDYYGRTSVNMDHFHTFTGSTAVQESVPGGHVHSYANETRVAMNHTHLMNGTSSPQVPVVLGHVHRLSGTTSMAENHTHTYDLYTGYQRPPRNVRRPRLFSLGEESKEETKAEGDQPSRRRPRLRLEKRKPINPQSEQK